MASGCDRRKGGARRRIYTQAIAERNRPMAAIVDSAARAGRVILNTLLPPRCLRCAGAVDRPGALCPICWAAISFLGPPQCACCGYPFEFNPGEGALCASCIRQRPVYRRARSVFRYDDASKDLVLGFKHADRTEGAPEYGRWLARAAADMLSDIDLIAPVPLHWWRLFRRRYNQAAMLALALSRASGVPAVPDLLIRQRATPSQGRLGPADRRRNVRGAFAVSPRRRHLIDARSLLLVDDVLTTGATAEACAETLLRAGAAAVDLLTLARVVRPRV